MAVRIVRHPHQMLMPRVWALRDNATACQATCFELAEALGATLFAFDAALGAILGQAASVDVAR